MKFRHLFPLDCRIAAVVLLAYIAALLVGVARSDEPLAKFAKPELLHTEADAVDWAFVALSSYSEEDRPYVRFVYIPPWGSPDWIGVMNFAVNSACSQSPVLHKADVHAGGWLLAYNLLRLAPDPVKCERLVSVWDGLATRESRFHVSAINFFGVQGAENAPVLAPHLQVALAKHATDPSKDKRVDVLVAQLTDSPGAIYSADFLLEQLLTSVRGRYPEFRQMDFTVKEGTPFGQRLFQAGYFRTESRDRLGEKGALLLTSGVTGKSRVVMTNYGVGSRLPLAVTFDFKDARVRPDQQFIRNLISFEPQADASEAFAGMSNGLIEFLLADANGNLQRSAPPDVVCDSTKPDGFTKELEMGMSCVICHSPDSGYRTAKNDMEFLLGADSDYFGDEIQFGGRILTKQEAVAVVVSRYGERIDEPDGVLGRARRDYIRAVDSLTDYPVTPEATSVQKLGSVIKSIYHEYRYRTIDAQRACLELGVRVSPEAALSTLKSLVPPPQSGEQEDVMIALLRNGASIKRDDMDAIYVEMARRAVQTRASLKE